MTHSSCQHEHTEDARATHTDVHTHIYIVRVLCMQAKQWPKEYSKHLTTHCPFQHWQPWQLWQQRQQKQPTKNVFMALKLYNLSLHIKSHRKLRCRTQSRLRPEQVNLQLTHTHAHKCICVVVILMCRPCGEFVYNQGWSINRELRIYAKKFAISFWFY